MAQLLTWRDALLRLAGACVSLAPLGSVISGS